MGVDWVLLAHSGDRYDSREAHGKALGLHHSKLCGREINVELTVGVCSHAYPHAASGDCGMCGRCISRSIAVVRDPMAYATITLSMSNHLTVHDCTNRVEGMTQDEKKSSKKKTCDISVPAALKASTLFL